MSAPEIVAAIHELESYGLVFTAAADSEIEEALTELSLADEGAEGE